MSLNGVHSKGSKPDIFGMRAVAALLGKRPITARSYARTLYARGTQGIVCADDGTLFCTELGVEAMKLESMRPGRASRKTLRFV